MGIQEVARKLVEHYGTVTDAADSADVERTMFNRIACGTYRCGVSVPTAIKIRDALKKATGEYYTLDEIYSKGKGVQ